MLSNWQFERNERLRKKVVPWTEVGIDESLLEPGDKLLDWKRGGTGYRYVHLITEREMEELAEASGFKVEQQFLADNDLNLYSVLDK